jgi:hypothetical protein
VTKETIIFSIACVTVLGLFGANASSNLRALADPAISRTQQEHKPVEQVRKNIQVLKGMPDSQLLPVMHIMRTSLGVRCDYCHVAENGKYWMDDKPAKLVARKMLQMVFDINKNNFDGKTLVSCNSCHRGSTKPVAVPAIGQGAFLNTTFDDAPKTPEALPSAEQLFDKYVEALGGKAAIDKIKTRSSKVTLLRPKLVNSGTPKAAMLTRSETWTMETFHKRPDKYVAIITTPEGVINQGFNGTVGWIKTATERRELNSAQLARMKREVDLYRDVNLRERYSRMAVTGKEKVGDREAYVIEATSVDNKPEKLFFDTQTGLLLRRTVFTETKLGMDPQQTDYEDYRAVDGVWLPFTIKVSFLDDSHYGTTRKLTEVRQNLPIDDAKFNMPVVQ